MEIDEPLTTLAYVVVVTRHRQLGASAIEMPQRNGMVLAEEPAPPNASSPAA